VKLFYYSLLVIAGFLAMSLASFWLTVRPPRLVIPVHPRDYNLQAEEVTIPTDDGLRLSAWLVPRAAAPAIILLHGYPAEKADLLPLAAALHPYFTTLLVDLRYFGKSAGRATTFGFRERRDLRRAIDFLGARGFDRVGVFGFSLGGAVGIMTAAEDARIRAVAAYAPFADLRTLGHEVYSFLWVLKYPLVEAMILWARLFLGGNISRPSPATAAATLSIPVLLIHSRGDEQIAFGHAELLRRALARNPDAEFHFIERGRHGEFDRGLDERITAFFKEHLAGC